jgi:hypothetical protein
MGGLQPTALYVPDFTTRSFRGRVRPMRVSVMSPRLSVDRNAVAPIGKPMAFRHIAAEDEHWDVGGGAVDGDFRGEDSLIGNCCKL